MNCLFGIACNIKCAYRLVVILKYLVLYEFHDPFAILFFFLNVFPASEMDVSGVSYLL